LGDIAGDDGARVVAQAGEEHEHLLPGAILGFVEDNEGVVQGAAAHVGERGDFDGAAALVFLDLLGGEHIVEGIVEGAEVGGDFLVEIAGEEAQGFAGLHGGSGKDDAGDLVFAEGEDGHGHGEVGFAGAGGAYAQSEVVFAGGLDVAFLADGFGGDGGFAGGGLDTDAE